MKKVPQIADVGTVTIRFINNVIGGENFIDMARCAEDGTVRPTRALSVSLRGLPVLACRFFGVQ